MPGPNYSVLVIFLLVKFIGGKDLTDFLTFVAPNEHCVNF